MNLINKIKFYFFKKNYPSIFTFDEYTDYIKYSKSFYIHADRIVFRDDYAGLNIIRNIYIKKISGLWTVFVSTKFSQDHTLKVGDPSTSLNKVIGSLKKLIYPTDLYPTSMPLIRFEERHIKDLLIKQIANTENIPDREIEDMIVIFKDIETYLTHSIGFLHYTPRFAGHNRMSECLKNTISPQLGFVLKVKKCHDSYLEVRHLEENIKILHKGYVFFVTEVGAIDTFLEVLVYKSYRSTINLY